MTRREEAFQYRHFPEGSLPKKFYDRVFLSLEDFLEKHYQKTNLARWNYVNQKYVDPLFAGSDRQQYLRFLRRMYREFRPDENMLDEFWTTIKDDTRFDIELKRFFSFLHSIDFFSKNTFENWLIVRDWKRSPFPAADEHEDSISELLKYKYAGNYLKEQLATLSFLN